MQGNCTFVSSQMLSTPIDDIVKEAPKGKVPMFLVTSVNEHASDYAHELHGEYVYVKDDIIIDPLTGQHAVGIEPENLHFCRYIDVPSTTGEML